MKFREIRNNFYMVCRGGAHTEKSIKTFGRNDIWVKKYSGKKKKRSILGVGATPKRSEQNKKIKY